MNEKKKIAVVGVGSTGLGAIKCCIEDNVQVVGFERTNDIGGLWRFQDKVTDGQASVMKSTVINTSKEMSAYSDFPPPPEFPNFMHNNNMLKYFRLYAEKFDLIKHIRFNHEILMISKTEDYKKTGKWRIQVRDLTTNTDSQEIFDGVMICTGHHAHPKMATFPGMDSFRGSIIHSHSYRVPDGYEDKNVLVVGIGNSGVDVAVELGSISKQVYLSTRRGAWVIPRRGPNGRPIEFIINNRLSAFLQSSCINQTSSLLETFANFHFNHELYDIKPKHRIFNQHPTLSDLLCARVLSGTVIMKGDVKRFTENGVIFSGDENKEYPIDAVVLATGYFVKFPYLEDDVVSFSEDHIDLYKLMFPPHLEHPSFAFIGMIQPIGSVFPIGELQSRWFVQLMLGNVQLPSKDMMIKSIEDRKKLIRESFYGGWRHVTEVLYVPYMDDLASQIGVKPNLKKMMFTDFKLFWRCLLGPCVPYQYRLEGHRSWPGARKAILTVNDRVSAALKTRNTRKMSKESSQKFLLLFFAATVFMAVCVYYFRFL